MKYFLGNHKCTVTHYMIRKQLISPNTDKPPIVGFFHACLTFIMEVLY